MVVVEQAAEALVPSGTAKWLSDRARWVVGQPIARALISDPRGHGRHQTHEGINMSAPAVVITGALTGIGRATALAFAREAARIIVSGRRDDVGVTLAKELRVNGGKTAL